MLTQEQADELHIKALKGQAVNLTELIKHAYAAGAKDMQERCAKVCRDVEAENSVPPLIDLVAVECANRIWALGTT